MRLRGIVALGLCLTLVTAGCERDATTASAKGIKASDTNPVPRSELRDGGTLRIAQSEFRTQWNFFHVNGAHAETSRVLRAVMPNLFRSDSKGVVSPNPNYLVSARVVKKKPRQVVSYKLNPKARWSSGDPFSYRDLAASWKAIAGRGAGYQVSSSTGWDQISKVERGTNDREAIVTFAEPFGEWQSLFSPLYPASEFSSPRRFNKSWIGRMPVTAGPFKLGKIDQTAKTITVVRDSRWWGPSAKLDKIVFRTMTPEAEAGAFINGEIDTFDVGSDASAYKRASSAKDSVIRKAAGPDYTHLTFNGSSPMLSDVRVRRGLAMALNRKALAESALKDLDWPVRTLGNHVFMHNQKGYSDNSGSVGKYDLTRAEELLDGAGWKRRGDYRVRGGKRLSVRFVYGTSTPISKQMGELTQAMLAKAGVKVELRGVPDNDLFDKYIIPGNYELAPFSWIGTSFPYAGLPSIYGRPRRGEIEQNFARIGSREIDRLLDLAVRELDPAEAREVATEADELIWQEVHTQVLYQRPQLTPVRSDIANWGSFGLTDPIYENIGFTR